MEKKTIIVIDDDKVILKIITKTLEDNGFEVECFSNPIEGLEHVKNNRPDAIILDRIMPEMDGNDVVFALQNDHKTRDIPIMMMTSQSHITDITASLGLGARDYIVKPFDHDNIIIRLKRIMGLL
jgi:DNA-binding response OmpR family regulator